MKHKELYLMYSSTDARGYKPINFEMLTEWGRKKDRNFLAKYNLNNNSRGDGKPQITRIDHSKFVGDVVVFHTQHKKRKSE